MGTKCEKKNNMTSLSIFSSETWRTPAGLIPPAGHGRGRSLTCMRDREAVGRLQVVHVVVEMKRLLGGVLVGVVELDSEPERAVLLHRGAHEQPPFGKMRSSIRHLNCPTVLRGSNSIRFGFNDPELYASLTLWLSIIDFYFNSCFMFI